MNSSFYVSVGDHGNTDSHCSVGQYLGLDPQPVGRRYRFVAIKLHDYCAEVDRDRYIDSGR